MSDNNVCMSDIKHNSYCIMYYELCMSNIIATVCMLGLRPEDLMYMSDGGSHSYYTCLHADVWFHGERHNIMYDFRFFY